MSLRSLILSRGSTLGDAARACRVEIALFDRIDAGRQALPRSVAERLAALLGVSAAEAIVEAPAYTEASTPSLLRPAPPLLGIDPYEARPLAAPREPRPGIADSPAIFALRNDPEASTARLLRIGRDDGSIGPEAVPALCYRPRQIVELAGRLWTVSAKTDPSLPSPNERAAFAFEPKGPQAVVAGTFGYGGPCSLVAEPESGTLWVAESEQLRVAYLDVETGDPLAFVLTGPYVPADACDASGLVYVAARHEENPANGKVIVIDPAGPAVSAESAAVPFARAIASDGAGLLYVACTDPGGAVVRRLAEDDLGTVQTLAIAGPQPNAPSSMLFAGGFLWIADRSAGVPSSARVLRVDVETGASAAAEYPTAAPVGGGAGRLAFDGVYLWMPDEQGQLVKIHPGTLEVLLRVEGFSFAAVHARA